MAVRAGRRSFLRGAALAAASGALPRLSWADAGAPAYLAAAGTRTGAHVLCGLSSQGGVRFRIPLPGRGHAAAAHPAEPQAVAFARRPGTFALVIDCALGAVRARLEAPIGRHFCGHGAFSADGRRLFTAENDFEAGLGFVGVWDAGDGYRRIGEMASGGVGPHELLYDGAARRLIVANGGIRTHPDSGKAKLNLPTMRPNLAYLDADTGAALSVVEPPEALRQGSLRHLAVSADGLVAVGAQWEGDPAAAAPLLALHRFGDTALRFIAPPAEELRRMRGYAGSVAIASDAAVIALTGPRGGRVQLYSEQDGFLGVWPRGDICGVAPGQGGFLATDGGGGVARVTPSGFTPIRAHDLFWDNHLVWLG